jgi:hypothetical protein
MANIADKKKEQAKRFFVLVSKYALRINIPIRIGG